MGSSTPAPCGIPTRPGFLRPGGLPSPTRSAVGFLSALLVAGAFSHPSALQGQAPGAGDALAAEASLPLFENLGGWERVLHGLEGAGVRDEVQAWFNQGMRLTFGFGHPQGIASFRQARTLDPGCAMCWWGEGWALGPYINQATIAPGQEREAWEAANRALELSGEASPAERALIEALAVRYRPDRATGESRAPQDSAYARAMAEVVRAHPQDLEAGTLWAEALMVLSPWNLWEEDGAPRPGTPEAVAALESVLGRDLSHPGACHLYIHLVEASPEPGRAAPCATLLETAIPGVSHVAHMPAHIFMRVGRYGDAVRGNLLAWHADQQAAFGGPDGVYPSHNLHMLAFAASVDGQSAIALQAARDLARIAPASGFYRTVTLARFGRWEELLEGASPPERPMEAGVWHFGRGLALARTGRVEEAEASLEAVRAQREAVGEARFRRHAQADLLGVAEGILAGEMAAARGDWDEAVLRLEVARALEDGLAYDEPEPWFIPVRHVLGAVLFDAGRPEAAEAVHRQALEIHPENGWSLFGLVQSLRAQGREGEAREVESRLARAWERSDTWLRGSRY